MRRDGRAARELLPRSPAAGRSAASALASACADAYRTCDVWEHTYYLDYRNLRPKYVETCLTALVNRDVAAENFE